MEYQMATPTVPPEIIAAIISEIDGKQLVVIRRVCATFQSIVEQRIKPVRDIGEARQAVKHNDLLSVVKSRGVDWAQLFIFAKKKKYPDAAQLAWSRIEYWVAFTTYVPGEWDQTLYMRALDDGGTPTEKTFRNIGQYSPQMAMQMIETYGNDHPTSTQLYYGLCKGGHSGYVKQIIPGKNNDKTEVALYSAKGGNRELVDLFTDGNWIHVLVGAIKGGHKELIEYALTKDIHDYSYALVAAFKHGCVDLIKILIYKVSINPTAALNYSRNVPLEVSMLLIENIIATGMDRLRGEMDSSRLKHIFTILVEFAYTVDDEPLALALEDLGGECNDARKLFLLRNYRTNEITDLNFTDARWINRCLHTARGMHGLDEFVYQDASYRVYGSCGLTQNADRVADHIHSLGYTYIYGNINTFGVYDIYVPALKLKIVLTPVQTSDPYSLYLDTDYEQKIDEWIFNHA